MTHSLGGAGRDQDGLAIAAISVLTLWAKRPQLQTGKVTLSVVPEVPDSMRMIVALATASVLAAAPLTAQTTLLVGRILDTATAKPVTPGWVTIMGTALSAPLREDGSFALSVPIREITASIRADGYKT